MKIPKTVPLDPAETVEDAWVAGISSRNGRRAKWGGTLVLTDQRWLSEPLQVPTMTGDDDDGEVPTETLG